MNGATVAIGGPPHSGKSVFAAALYNAIKGRSRGAFMIRACPDGEGMWFHEGKAEVVSRLRKKGEYSEEWINTKLRDIEVASSTKRLLLVDLGGKLSDYTRQVLQLCTHIIVVSSDDAQSEAWRAFAAESRCQTLAVFQSVIVKDDRRSLDLSARSEIRLDIDPIHGRLVNLARHSADDPYADAVDALATVLITRFRLPSHCGTDGSHSTGPDPE
jgi:CRISPR-associated protein Csx3